MCVVLLGFFGFGGGEVWDLNMGVVFVVLVVCVLFCGCVSEPSSDGWVDETIFEGDGGGVVFEFPPVDLDKVAFILPLGGMTGSHVTPIDHQYLVSYDFELGDAAEVDIAVFAPAGGVVTSIQHMGVAVGDPPIAVDDFRLVIEHTAQVSSIFIHVDRLSEKLMEFDPGFGNYTGVQVAVGAGEVLGWYGGSVDYNVVDETVVLGFVNPLSYVVEPWKIHCPDPFDYFNESIREVLVEKCVRTASPVGGRICYDVDGRLIGNWFKDGTNGYGGVDVDRYWAGHLSVVYDSIDPDAVIVSIGTFVDRSEQFTVVGNGPDPAEVGVAGGVVLYELVDFEYVVEGSVWDRNSLVKGLVVRACEGVRGVLLVEMVEEQVLRVEVFPGLTAAEVDGFTKNATLLVR